MMIMYDDEDEPDMNSGRPFETLLFKYDGVDVLVDV